VEFQFHSLVQRWFTERFGTPTLPQQRGWESIAAGRSTLIAAPTGSGKTLAAFLWSIDRLIKRALSGELDDHTSVVYISPLKALGNDIAKNLESPLAEIYERAGREGILLPSLRIAVRSGDTPARERQQMARRPPHILITTPESFYILLTAPRSRSFLRGAETVIVDEIHAVAADKRGAHLALSLERLDQAAERPLQRIGLSATQKPIEEVARLLVGTRRVLDGGAPDCAIVDTGHQRDLDLSIEIPDEELGPIIRQDIWAAVYDKIVAQIKAHRTTLVFVNTRRLVERVAHQLSERLGENQVGAHHGSLSRKTRLEVEEKLKTGVYPVVVATASLELGIDIGHVDVVCHIGAPRALAVLLQRVGRSGHWLGAIPKGVFYPLTRDDLLQGAAAIRAVRAGELDRLSVIGKALDVLAQQVVATVASADQPINGSTSHAEGGISEDNLWRLVKGAYPYRELSREQFEQVLEMLSDGVATRHSRRGAYLHRDRIHGMLRPRRGARLIAITNGGAIPDMADYDVVEFPEETFIGKVNEDFAIESLAGDIFLLGNRSWRIRRVGSGKVWVEDAQGLPPTIPFWLGEAPGRTRELSRAVSDLRRDVAALLTRREHALEWLAQSAPMPAAAAEQIVDYVAETQALLGAVPEQERIIAERFFDEAGGMQLVIHSPWGARINRAWGMALRKRFCVSFDRELQAAATDDGIVISLVQQHSFALGDVFLMLRPAIIEETLIQAALASPLFTNRWRWNSTRALALLRHSGGKKVPVALQRMRAEDLLAAVFPEQTMCQDNRAGEVVIPDHPLVAETLSDCLHEAMDMSGLVEITERIMSGEIATVAVDTPAPSPMAHEILNANPYAFLDDAPLEERRARAVSLRRIDPWLGREFGQLDAAAIDEVRRQAWPDIRNADELHDWLLSICLLPLAEGCAYTELAAALIADGRATIARWPSLEESGEISAWVAAERCDLLRLCVPNLRLDPPVSIPLDLAAPPLVEEEAWRRIVGAWLEAIGPTTAAQLAARLNLPLAKIDAALLGLESAGAVLRGEFTGRQPSPATEWCDRTLLARIHRLTLGRRRKEIEAVSAAEFMEFLLHWQHVAPSARLTGRDGVLRVIEQLQGLELPAPAWERHVLPARLEAYEPADLEHLCLGGVVAWGRLRGHPEETDTSDSGATPRKRGRRLLAPARNAPIAFLQRDALDFFLDGGVDWRRVTTLSPMAREVAAYLERQGASFLSDIARETGSLKVKVEEALWQLVAHGLASGDGIAGLRVLLAPERERAGNRRNFRLLPGGRSPERSMPVGRWALWRRPDRREAGENTRSERKALQLLDRYGVVFRDLLARESDALPWRALLQIYRRAEARGEIRGGRFVDGFVGEQFALPQAVEMLRAHRANPSPAEPVIVSAADPLNLLGILSPGPRLSPYSNQVIAYHKGIPIEIGPLGAVLSRTQHMTREQ
jgi:ATP-dependent Lhr-like helicase